MDVLNPFGIDASRSGASAEADDYLKAKFSKAKVSSSAPKKKPKAKPRPKVRTQEEEELEAERELLGLAPKPAEPPAQVDPAPVPGPERVAETGLGAGVATRLAVAGSKLEPTSRTCPDGHPLQCYMVGWSAAICDNCDRLQRPGKVVFGCSSCEWELCSECVLRTAGADSAVQADFWVISRVAAQQAELGSSRFVATASGTVVDTAPALPEGPVKKQPEQGPDSIEAPAEPARPEGRNGANSIDEHSWKAEAASAPAAPDSLSKMIAEQEAMIQDCGLWLRETKEALESSKPSTRPAARSPADTSSAAPPREAAGPGPNLMDENAARSRPEHREMPKIARDQPLERTFDLTLTLVADFVDELARGYSQAWYQELVLQCAEECHRDRRVFLRQLQDAAFQVQRPILENWGFDGDEQGVFDMTSILREHSQGAPDWLQEKVDRCLTLMYGGSAAGML